MDPQVVRLTYQQPKTLDDATVVGNIIHIETPLGNVVTNIPKSLLDEQGLSPEDNVFVTVKVMRGDESVFEQQNPYAKSFGFASQGEPLLYADSLKTIGLAVNGGSFAKVYGVKAGGDWTILIGH